MIPYFKIKNIRIMKKARVFTVGAVEVGAKGALFEVNLK